jgi:DNA-binding CsgD family transcriptional regulator
MTDLEIVRLISEGYRQKEMAAIKGCPVSSMETTITRLRRKYGAKSMSHLVTIFWRNGWLK